MALIRVKISACESWIEQRMRVVVRPVTFTLSSARRLMDRWMHRQMCRWQMGKEMLDGEMDLYLLAGQEDTSMADGQKDGCKQIVVGGLGVYILGRQVLV